MALTNDYVWTDKSWKRYKLSDLTDTHLSNIIRHVNRGGGYPSEMNIINMIKMYDEAIRRGLQLPVGKREFITNAERTINYQKPLDFTNKRIL